jgi:hypothetical protein
MHKPNTEMFSRRLPSDLVRWMESGVEQSKKDNPFNPVFPDISTVLRVALIEVCQKYNFPKPFLPLA